MTLCLTLCACDLTPPTSSPLTPPTARPQAITLTSDGEHLAVTDVSFREGGWGEGRLLLFHINTRARPLTWYTPNPNPQALLSAPNGLLVVSGGRLDLTGDLPSASQGALSWLPLTATPVTTLPLHGYYPISAAFSAPEATLSNAPPEPPPALTLSSGVLGELRQLGAGWPLTPTGEPWTPTPYAPPNALSLATLARWRDHTLALDFNTDTLHILTPSGDLAPCAPRLGGGGAIGVMEGAQTPRVRGDTLWVSFGLSGRLIELDLTTLDLSSPTCSPTTHAYTPALGAIPNDLAVDNERVYALLSGEQEVWSYRRSTRAREARGIFPHNTHPWQMTLDEPRGALWVTGWLSGSIWRVDLHQGLHIEGLHIEEWWTAQDLDPPPPTRCARPIELSPHKPPLRGAQITLTWPEPPTPPPSSPAQASDLQGAPQLALLVSALSGDVLIEAQLHAGGPWRPLSPTTLPSPHPSARTATSDPCALFTDPNAITAPLAEALSPLARELHLEAGRLPLYALRLTALSGSELSLTDASYRAW